MTINQLKSAPSLEYIAIVATLISIGALGTDLMLPALGTIGFELGVGAANDVHYIVTAFFFGMAAGQLIAGPLSDTFRRKPVIYAGYALFVIGCTISMVIESWAIMLLARVLQGFGAAAPGIVTVALVRDRYEGNEMARIMSIVMVAFIVVQIIAPSIGEGLIIIGVWRFTFLVLAVLTVVVLIWFAYRQPETLSPKYRRAFHPKQILAGTLEIVRNRVAFGYTIATGLLYGMFVGYLGTAQQVFEVTFQVGDLFVFYFALASAALGLASLINAHLVVRYGMRRLTFLALRALTGISAIFWGVLLHHDGVPSLALFLIWQLSAFFCVGITFGNLNALALEPLGHMAGLGAGFIGSIATFISLPLAAVIGHQFDGTVFALVAGFAILGLVACAVVIWAHHTPPSEHNG